nr:retrovirus-related Pol polyprotein from transposon TNT 1-94 [Tanacetum cinerariifolium]
MSTQQDIYATGSENCPPIRNKENYLPWSSRLLCYTKSRPNEKLIYNSIMNGPYVRQMIPEPGDSNCEVPFNETFHEQTNDELTEKELKSVEADDQAIQTILLGLPEDIYTDVDSCETAQKSGYVFTSTDRELIESYCHRFLKLMNDFKRNKHFPEKIANELRAKRLATAHDLLALIANSNNPFNYPVFHQNQSVLSSYMQQPQPNNNYNLQPSFNQNYMQQPMPNPEDITDLITAMNITLIAQPGMNMGQDRQMQMVGGNGGNQFRQYARQNNVGKQNELIVFLGIANQNLNKNGNVVAARAEGNAIRNNADLDEIEEVNANCILMANLQRASTSGTYTDKAPVYDSDGSAEEHNYDNIYDNEIFCLLKRSSILSYSSPFLNHTKYNIMIVMLFLRFLVWNKVDETNDLSNPVTSNSVPTPEESKVMKNNNVIATGMFRINPSKTSREDKFVPINKVRASVRTNLITVSQPHVITKKGTVRFENDHVAAILGFGDLKWGYILITKVYFVEGLGYNLFSIRQFCDSDLEVAFRRNICFVRNLEGVDLLKGNRTTNLYTLNLYEMASASLICLLARATSTKSWLWHQCLSHLNFDTINDLAKNDLVTSLPKFKYHKEHLCPSC